MRDCQVDCATCGALAQLVNVSGGTQLHCLMNTYCHGSDDNSDDGCFRLSQKTEPVVQTGWQDTASSLFFSLHNNVHHTGSPRMQFSEFVSNILDGLQQPPGLWSSIDLCLLMLWTWLVPNDQLHWHLHSAEEPTTQAAADLVQDLPLLLATRLTFVSNASHQRSPHSLYTIPKQNQLVPERNICRFVARRLAD